MVIVVLVLSLIVQSLQAIIKKWFKLKSRSILNSLHDLFEYVRTKEATTKSSAQLIVEIKEEFKKLGRVSLIRKTPMVDSIAKEDLLKILERIGAGALTQQVDKWYETVMQGFEERYTRHMKSVAICVSIVVVIFLNANFFQVYHNISTNDVLRNVLLEKRDEIEKKIKDSGQQGDQESQDATEQLKNEIKQLQNTMDETVSLGFSPIKPKQVTDFFSPDTKYPEGRFAHALKVISGWAIMVMLLSVGAPFWQDALESLFGIKNLLRKKSDTQNVEDDGGQPKP